VRESDGQQQPGGKEWMRGWRTVGGKPAVDTARIQYKALYPSEKKNGKRAKNGWKIGDGYKGRKLSDLMTAWLAWLGFLLFLFFSPSSP